MWAAPAPPAGVAGKTCGHFAPPPPLPSRFHLLLPSVTRTTHPAVQSIGGEGERRRRRRRRKSRRHSRPLLVFAGPERRRRSSRSEKVRLSKLMYYPPSSLVSFLSSPPEIQADSRPLRHLHRRGSRTCAILGRHCAAPSLSRWYSSSH